MFTTVDETGRLNNYASEPQVYVAAYPSVEKLLESKELICCRVA